MSPTQRPDVKIAIMGPTGTGKSSLIHLITGDNNIKIGHSVQSETSEIGRANYFESDGRCVTFIDTPGFDDSREGVTDAVVLQQIAAFLDAEYKNRQPTLNGIIYLHRITDPRMGGNAVRNLKMFQKLCGSESLKNVVIVTTRWDKIDEKAGTQREQELMTNPNFFKPLVDAHARFLRHDGTSESARKIMFQLLTNDPITLQIQYELARGTELEETEAGMVLTAEMNGILKRHKEELESLRKEVEEAIAAKDDVLKTELEEERDKLKHAMNKWAVDKQRLEDGLDTVRPGAQTAVEAAEHELEERRRLFLLSQLGPPDMLNSGILTTALVMPPSMGALQQPVSNAGKVVEHKFHRAKAQITVDERGREERKYEVSSLQPEMDHSGFGTGTRKQRVPSFDEQNPSKKFRKQEMSTLNSEMSEEIRRHKELKELGVVFEAQRRAIVIEMEGQKSTYENLVEKQKKEISELQLELSEEGRRRKEFELQAEQGRKELETKAEKQRALLIQMQEQNANYREMFERERNQFKSTFEKQRRALLSKMEEQKTTFEKFIESQRNESSTLRLELMEEKRRRNESEARVEQDRTKLEATFEKQRHELLLSTERQKATHENLIRSLKEEIQRLRTKLSQDGGVQMKYEEMTGTDRGYQELAAELEENRSLLEDTLRQKETYENLLEKQKMEILTGNSELSKGKAEVSRLQAALDDERRRRAELQARAEQQQKELENDFESQRRIFLDLLHERKEAGDSRPESHDFDAWGRTDVGNEFDQREKYREMLNQPRLRSLDVPKAVADGLSRWEGKYREINRKLEEAVFHKRETELVWKETESGPKKDQAAMAVEEASDRINDLYRELCDLASLLPRTTTTTTTIETKELHGTESEGQTNDTIDREDDGFVLCPSHDYHRCKILEKEMSRQSHDSAHQKAEANRKYEELVHKLQQVEEVIEKGLRSQGQLSEEAKMEADIKLEEVASQLSNVLAVGKDTGERLKVLEDELNRLKNRNRMEVIKGVVKDAWVGFKGKLPGSRAAGKA